MTSQRLTVQEAAEFLGTSVDAVRMRVRRGSLPSEKDSDGRVYVWVDGDSSGTEHELNGESTSLISAKDETIATLREQLQAERQAHAEARRIIAGLVERVPPAIEAPDRTADLLEAERRQRIEDVQRERAERLEAQERAEKLREELEAERSKGFWERLFGTPEDKGTREGPV